MCSLSSADTWCRQLPGASDEYHLAKVVKGGSLILERLEQN